MSRTRTNIRSDEQTVPGGTVHAVIDRLAEETPGQTYLVAPESGRELDYLALRQRAAETAARLSSLGLEPGDTVSFLLGNGAGTAELILGSMYGGYVCAPLNAATGPSQLAYVLGHSKPAVVFVSPPHEKQLRAAAESAGLDAVIVPTDVDTGPEWPAGGPTRDLRADVEPGDVAVLMYTSGTTGKPKGVQLTHANILAGGRNAAGAHSLSRDDCGLCVLPLCHINALTVSLMGVLVSGGTMTLPHGFSASRFWGWVSDYRCTWFSVVPTIIAYLLHQRDKPDASERAALERVRFGRSASAPLPPALHAQFESRFGIPIVETMGITEAAAQILANPMPPAEKKIGSPGLPYGNEVVIRTIDGRDPGPGGQGEILVRGPNVMLGYLDDTRATAAAVDADGWLHTGDLGQMDEDGFVFVTGRLKELIIKGGENISPREIDDALFEHPAVVEAGALGVPDEQLGEQVVACVVIRQDMPCTERELIDHCASRVGAFKAPRTIYFMSELPKGPTGKVLRHELAAKIRRNEPAGSGADERAG